MGRSRIPPSPSRPDRERRYGVLGSLRKRRADEKGAALVEFAIVVPLLILLLCGTIDFGLIFGGYQSMESGVASATRALSVGDYTYSGTNCTGGPDPATRQAVCTVAADLGPLTGINVSTLEVGICFVPTGSAPNCNVTPAQGTSVSNDVLVCAEAKMSSTTGLTSVFVSGSTVSTSSRVLQEQPQPTGQTAFSAYNANSNGNVDYNGNSVGEMTCT